MASSVESGREDGNRKGSLWGSNIKGGGVVVMVGLSLSLARSLQKPQSHADWVADQFKQRGFSAAKRRLAGVLWSQQHFVCGHTIKDLVPPFCPNPTLLPSSCLSCTLNPRLRSSVWNKPLGFPPVFRFLSQQTLNPERERRSEMDVAGERKERGKESRKCS
ncbi:unnamed protein product [Pleuronectes platessa]|uniref:Uncharacterized protein n=1 Tax=Pleuronectes platessa TaxID=8262 RepID=A0A9N7V7Z7_PLEPL|nr:unnamed protein product [Pleuronectes platessa]